MRSHGVAVATKLSWIAQRAREHPAERFSNLLHLLTPEFLRECFLSLRTDAAAGVDRVTYQDYARVADARLPALAAQVQRMGYVPLPVRRVYIPKDGTNAVRPLGIPALEDKIVQEGLRRILAAIFEGEFLDCSHGFRPGRGCHTALTALRDGLMGHPINYVIDADIKGFFDTVDHVLLMRCVEGRVADPRVLRYLWRFLKAGVWEDGLRHPTAHGVPQGSLVSPLLANLYLHYGLDRWFTETVRPRLRGAAILVRYADDFIIGVQHEADAVWLFDALQGRLAQCRLTLAPEKTRILLFGRYAEERAPHSRFAPGTLDFLGFTHYWGIARGGKWNLYRMTSRKKFRQKLQALKTWLTQVRHTLDLSTLWQRLNQKLQGHYAYYGITGNTRRLRRFYYLVRRLVFRLLNRCSRVPRWSNWAVFATYCQRFPLAPPRIVHALIV